MGDTSKIQVVWKNLEFSKLLNEHWTPIAQGYTEDSQRYYWLMAPPEPPEPTLAEQARYCAIRLRGHAATAAYGDLVDTMADALERGERVEAAARYAVDHQTEGGVVERLRNALEAQ